MITIEINNSIKSIVLSFFPDARIVLFGSRARGDFHQQSDFDLLIIIKKTLSPREKLEWAGKIHKILVYSLHAAFDVLLNSEDEVLAKKELPGHIVRWATKEGIEL